MTGSLKDSCVLTLCSNVSNSGIYLPLGRDIETQDSELSLHNRLALNMSCRISYKCLLVRSTILTILQIRNRTRFYGPPCSLWKLVLGL